MIVVPAVLVLVAAAVGLVPGAVPGIERAAGHLSDHGAYVGWVLAGGPGHFSAVATSHVAWHAYLYGGLATAGALAAAGLALFGAPLLDRLPGVVLRPAALALHGLRALHSGHIGDYIAWWTAGAGMLGGASLVLLR